MCLCVGMHKCVWCWEATGECWPLALGLQEAVSCHSGPGSSNPLKEQQVLLAAQQLSSLLTLTANNVTLSD